MRAFHIYDVERFDPGHELLCTKAQKVLLRKEGIDAPITYIRSTNEIINNKYRIYVGTHESRVNQRGRTFNDVEFPMYVAKKDFRVYYEPGKKFIIFEGAKKVVQGAVRSLQREYPGRFALKLGEVDFSYFRQHFINMWGGWIDHNNPHLKKIGLFGDHVDLTQDFSNAEALGSVSSICVDYPFGETICSIMISKQRIIVFYQSSDNVKDDLLKLEELLPFILDSSYFVAESAPTYE